MKRLGVIPAVALALTSMMARADPVSPSSPPTKDQCVDANEAAQTLRAAEKLRASIEKLTVCVSRSCPVQVRDDCAQRLNDLQSALPTVVFDVHSAAGADVSAVTVKIDGVLLTTQLDGSAIAVDPGKHIFTFEAEGFATTSEPLLIREGSKAQRERVVLSVPGEASGPLPATEAPGEHASGMRIGAFAALGVGAVGVLVGSIAGSVALGDKSSLSGECRGNVCAPAQQSELNGLRSSEVISDVGFGVGVVGLAAGAVIFLVSRSHGKSVASEPATARAFFGMRGAGISGTFQ